MRGEVLKNLGVQISYEIEISLGHRLVSVNPLQSPWDNIDLANHNVFRLNAKNEVVWQVRRVENPGTPSWPEKHAMAREWKSQGLIDGAFTDQGYLDPFTSMNLDERSAIDPEPQGVWRAGCVVYLLTRWWSYVLDPVTGVATCTGDQVK